jgi:energy-coupling factor transport system ATP-binding protein
MILLQDIWFSYPDAEKPVFSGLNLEIGSSDWVTVAGPDGSGKTTLGRIIKGLLLPQSGSIKLENDSSEAPFLSVGYVGADPSDFLVGISVEEDIAFGLENLALSAHEMTSRMEQALRWTGMQGMEKRLTETLSGGEQQKLALASTLALGARVLILDEAMAMLDRPTRLGIRELINGLRTDPGLTVVEVSNNFEDLLNANRILFLSAGEIIFDGAAQEFFLTQHGRQWISLTRGVSRIPASCGVQP